MPPTDNISPKRHDVSRLVSKIDEISTLPQVLRKVLRVASNPNAGASDLQAILKSDPALTSKILKLANSAYYGLAQEVTNVKRAVIFLGFKTIKNLVFAASVCEIFKSKEDIGGYSRELLWKHSVVVAILSKTISQRAGLNVGEDIFTTAILHDIGIIMEDQYLNKEFRGVVSHPHIGERGLNDIEQAELGFDHAFLGEQVSIRWKLPKEISKIIAYHHKPQNAPEEIRRSASIIYIADAISNANKIGYVTNSRISKTVFQFAMDAVGFKKNDIAIIINDLPEEIKKAKDLFVI